MLLILLAALAGDSPRIAITSRTGVVTLPAGLVEVDSEVALPEGAHDLEIRGAPQGTVLRMAAGFRGRALFLARSVRGVRFTGFNIDGNRAVNEKRAGLPAFDVPFVRFTTANGILAEDSSAIAIDDVSMRKMAGFAVIAARSTGVRIARLTVEDSGSRNAKGRNNTTGGVLLEEGTSDFEVRECTFRRIRGNGVWTHSLYTSPRNGPGVIARNRFEEIGRDAIQAGHATRVRVENNTGTRIGYPLDDVDAEGGGTPVAIDTAGNVDGSAYEHNRFEEINGKCIDLDGFHDGSVSFNTCVNRGGAADYPYGHFAIVMNNTNPDMRSENIAVEDNEIDGTKFGGIFVIGERHRIENNRMKRINLAHCNEQRARFGCYHFPGEPALLESGIYLGSRAERPAPSRGNVVRGNQVSGWKMDQRCIGYAPGVSPKENRVEANRCTDTQ